MRFYLGKRTGSIYTGIGVGRYHRQRTTVVHHRPVVVVKVKRPPTPAMQAINAIFVFGLIGIILVVEFWPVALSLAGFALLVWTISRITRK